jgi:hypothetical protein
LRCNAHGSNYACHNASTLAFAKSLARDAAYHAPKGDFCVRESSPSADGVRADGFIALADEDPSKDLIIDVFVWLGSLQYFFHQGFIQHSLFEKAVEAGYKKKDATYRGFVNSNNATVLSLSFTIFVSFCLNLLYLFDRFTQTIYDYEKDSYCRSLSSIIRKYYTNLGSVTVCLCLSPHSPKLGIFLRSLTMLMMLNATIYKMLYTRLPPPHYHLVFTILV